MPHPTTRRSAGRHSGGERVFADDLGRLWSASHTRGADGGAIVFACISDSRQPVCALALDVVRRLQDATDGDLRNWLREAPRIGRLS